MSFEFFIGSRYFKARKQSFLSLITFLSITGVTVGIMTLMVVIAVMTGAEADIRSSILGIQPHIMIMRHGSYFSDYREIVKQINEVEQVEAASPFIQSQILLRSSSGTAGAVLKGISPDSAGSVIKNMEEVLSKLQIPSTTGLGAGNDTELRIPGLILGKELAFSLKVKKNDLLQLTIINSSRPSLRRLPAMRTFQVLGIHESGVHNYDKTYAFAHITDLQKMMNLNDSVMGIEVRTDNIYEVRQIALNIVNNLGYPYWARDWMQSNQNLFSALKLQKTVMFIILILIILVAAFNISSALIMMVMGKTKDIAILRAIGTTTKSIKKIFVLKGMIIGFVGTSLGILFGFVICFLLENYIYITLPGDVYPIKRLPVQVEALDVFLICISTLLICYIATLYPAKQASKLDPVEAIRNS